MPIARRLLVVLTVPIAFSFVAAAVLAEGCVHRLLKRRPSDTAALARSIAQATGATARHVEIQASDETVLYAWWLVPQHPNGRAVIVCHGVADSSYGALGYALLFLSHGYAVLAPDGRGHGESGGLITYGVLETDDIVRWLFWMRQNGATETFGFGESLGGSILIQSLAQHANFRALIAECPYASFESIAEERVARIVSAPIAFLLVKEGILYIRLRYGVNLANARPALAIAHTHVPILLIHGLADNETSPANSIQLAHNDPASAQLWLVPNARHTGAYATDPVTFENKVLNWFAAH